LNDDQIKESVINNRIQNDRIHNAAHKPKRLFRWRIVFAVLLSILLHLVLIPDFDFNNTPPKPLILTATLTSDTFSQTDDTDQRGELDTNEKINQAATAKKANISPDPPKARPTTAPPPTKTAQTPKQPKSPQQPSAVKQ
jgi:outer membrane biosynthesis protein TonB